METQIFYWTGVVIWWCLCIAAIFAAFVAAVIAPFAVHRGIKKYWWQWKWAAEIGRTGIKHEDIVYATHIPAPNDVPLEDMVDWFRRVKNRMNEND